MKPALLRLRGRKGMTLMETLAAVLIIALLTTVVLSGSQAAFRVYVQDTFASESQNVSDTINRALSDVLRYAVNIKTDSDGRVTAYTNSSYGVTDGLICLGQASSADEGLIFLDYYGEGDSGNILLLSDLSYSRFRVVPADYDPDKSGDSSSFDLQYSGGLFTGSYRLYDPASQLLSDTFIFSLRAVND
ncbi:type II secretion system protein [Lachnospiraceae bacterium 54-53]